MKYYVVWEGLAPGIYDSWAECQAQILGVKGARYKSFKTLEAATQAFREGADKGSLYIFEEMVRQQQAPATQPATEAVGKPQYGIAVDGACTGNPGPMEYRGVDLASGQVIFSYGPLNGTNNAAEYLAIVHAAALLAQRGDGITPIYSDSAIAIKWVTHYRHNRCQLAHTAATAAVWALLDRADAWLASHTFANDLLKWETALWGEIPADYGRK